MEIKNLIVLQLIVQMYNMCVVVLRKLMLHGTHHVFVLVMAVHMVVAKSSYVATKVENWRIKFVVCVAHLPVAAFGRKY